MFLVRHFLFLFGKYHIQHFYNDYKLYFTHHNLFAEPTVIVGKDIKIETHGSSIPIYCESTYRVRTVPGMTNDDVIKQLNSVIYNLTKNDTEIHAEIETIKAVKPSEPLNTQESRKLLKIGGKAVKTVTGYELKPYPFAGGNDTRWLRSVGIPTIVLGPADIFRYGGHRPDEWVSIDRLIDFTKIYGLMAMEICKIK